VALLEALPESQKGEIIDGELHVLPRPRFRHGRASGFFGYHLGGPFDFDPNGPGGWWILIQPGINLPGSPEVSPDLAGWRRSTLPEPPPENEPLRTVPDWVCEVLSPKMPATICASNSRFMRASGYPGSGWSTRARRRCR
jgi:Uma2 family endonuclease